MDNLTHTLVGIALADLAIGRRATKAQRPLVVGAGIIAANLPDIDLAYSSITTQPVGYLLHHRGHTHTIAGLAMLGLVLVCVYWFFPSVQKLRWSERLRFILLIVIALASHLALDALNNYGVHPFYPSDNRWLYGDAVFIFEPALWLLLGIAIAANARTRLARLVSAVPMIAMLFALASTRIVPLSMVVALAIAGGVFASFAYRVSPPMRAAAALALCGLIVGGFALAARHARGTAVSVLRPELQGDVIDVILTPNPSAPMCWGVIAVETREAEYVLWSGTLSLAPAWTPPVECAWHQFADVRPGRTIGEGRFALRDEIHQPLPALRALAKNDCWVRAWLRFGRAPVIKDGFLFDLRYGERLGQNFSHLRLEERQGCPSHVPPWEMPRADLLE